MTFPSDRVSEPQTADSPAVRRSNRIVTTPNVLCAVRLACSPALVVLAVLEQPFWFLGLYLFLAFTDWLDGKLAILLDQRSVLGARLDSAADVTLYAALLFGGVWLTWDVIQSEVVWIGLAVGSYALSTAAGLWKFGRVPSYHTRAAKTSWLLILVAALLLFTNDLVWPLRAAMVFVLLTNGEALLITWVLRDWQADVASVFHAFRERRR